MRLGRDPPDERPACLRREQVFEAGSRLLRPGEHDANVTEPSDAAIERIGDVPKVPVDDRLDVALVARLRPAALVVPAGDVRRLVRERDEPASAEPVDVAALASDVRNDRTVPTSDEANERRQVELLRDPGLVLHRPRQRKRQKEVVQLRREHGNAADALAAELAAEPALDPLEIPRESLPLVVRERRAPLVQLPLGAREQRPRMRCEIPRSRHHARIETHVETHRAAVCRAEGRKLPQLFPRDRFGHAARLPSLGILTPRPPAPGTSIRPESFNTSDKFLRERKQ